MKPYQRRATGKYPYYKLATFDNRAMCFRDGKHAFATESEAKIETIQNPGKYRISIITETGRKDMPPFEIKAA
jgi:hypothetical protein